VIRRDPERLSKLRIAVRYLLRQDALERGHQTRLAEHFTVSRQRVHQVVNEEQARRERAALTRIRAANLVPSKATGTAPAPASAPAMEAPQLRG
jgi:hypothetical protein